MKIDSHQHFWQYSDIEYDWIDESMSRLQRDFLPRDLLTELQNSQIDGCVAVQARQSLEETNWLLTLADSNEFIKGVVGWIDLRSDDLSEQLESFNHQRKLCGFRHVLQGEPEPGFMLQDSFLRGLRTLSEFKYSYDLLVFAHQLPECLKLVEQLPELRLVVDHIAKPKISTGQGFQEWAEHMKELSTYPNVFCKVSGMVTEADWEIWQPKDFDVYLEVVFKAFGVERVMFGSDWPVCLVAGEYADIKLIVESYVEEHYPDAKDEVFGENACRFYQI